MSRATLIDGKAFAAKIRQQVAAAVTQLQQQHQLQPGLAVVLVGADPASQIYVRNKAKQTLETGMHSIEHRLPADTSQTELLELIEQLNADSAIHGILVQLPVPRQIDADVVINAIDPNKDVDGFHIKNTGKLWSGIPGLIPCTPLGCMMMLRDTIPEGLVGKHAVVVGRSNIVGKPISALLLREHCTVSIAHSRTKDLPGLCREADILVAAVGRAEMIKGDWVRKGATVIDVGINRIDAGNGKTRLTGDVEFAAAVQHAAAITPVPGGVGPMTIACLLRNTITAACLQTGYANPME
ncbi:MAG TPA: bifunctional methylenetetrahydrofolate dehydrogenase/methenyltetrahydrofolate cyclohydrolase FolD [Gammaproteobacteria bacterium]|mgnify:CR=1 FL=1|nr:bifunctional methylenetetrahydrofolate dehydrogenase/methenyltetrahydrofolate cyclohydrolase FolD [Gammaproteobacteria bacterium]